MQPAQPEPIFIPVNPRRQNRRRARAASPPAVNRILSVTRGESEDEVWITVAGIVTGLDFENGFEVSDGETAQTPIGGNFDDPSNVLVLFGASIAAATEWRVPEAGAWTFADSQPLQEPLEGEIAD